MLSRFFKKPELVEIGIIDSMFPQREPLGFRNYEINGLLNTIKGAKAFTMYPMKPGPKAWFHHGYGIKEETFNENKSGYLSVYPENRDKIQWLKPHAKHQIELAYSYFLAETYTLLPFYNKNKIPFVFTLYPGGAFGLGNEASDAMLYEIFKSPYFRGVITTQDVTHNYLLKKNMCPPEKIDFLFCGYTQWEKNEALPKKIYQADKNTFDLCFVAAKYTDKGIDKGYDLFIETAHKLSPKYPDMRFHVVGGFDKNDIDVSALGDKITFYGYQKPDFLKEFYTRMDICCSPNRPYKLFKGNFDGFPLGFDSMVCGTALFTTDELYNNKGFFSSNEIIIIKPDINDILNKIEFYYNNLDKLYFLSKNGQNKIDKIMNPVQRVDNVAQILYRRKNEK